MAIVAVDYRIVRWPIAPRGAARGHWTERAALLLAVRDETGATGLGEAAPLPGMSIDHIDDAIRAAEALSAHVPFTLDVPSHATALADRITTAPAARFAIETALLAALAQRTRTSIASLVAPLIPRASRSARNELGLAASAASSARNELALGAHEPTSSRNVLVPIPQAELRCAVVVDDEVEALAAVAAGASCLKIKAPSPADLERVQRIARAVPGIPLRIDANRGWPRDQARSLLASLAELPIDYVEEPCIDAHELLARHLPVRIALDESLIELTRSQLGHALESAQLAALVLKPTLLGGFARCLELAAAAHEHGIAPIVTHTLEGPVGTAACRELARAIGADVPVGLAPHEAELRPMQMQASCIESGQAGGGPSPTGENISSARDNMSSAGATISSADANTRRSTERPRVLVATHTDDTVSAIKRAFDGHCVIALLHAKTAPDELARQRAVIDAASFAADDAVVLFTSGSTGPSRGVVLSRQALLANAEASAARLGWRDDDRWLVCLPLAHAGGLSIVIRCLLADKPIVLGDVAQISDATIASLVPAQLAQLVEDPAWRASPKLRAVLLGGAAAPPSLIEAALARGVPVLQTYGLTETFGQVATARIPGGRPVALPAVELAAGTREAPAVIRIRGPMLATRYLDGGPIAPELVTADLGFLDGDELHVLGRADDVIISGGENVHPTQVEAVLAATPGVRAAAAFGVSDARWGQIVAAAITVEPAFDRSRALELWHAQLPAHARPRLLAMVGELPRLPSGKIDRRRIATVATSPVHYGR
jgi:acyl-coenzyme A synthetase/AMP-(fatty) acid ligase/L-alanine-DL-glutamate epimerase-like enolase superfamily enzyme